MHNNLSYLLTFVEDNVTVNFSAIADNERKFWLQCLIATVLSCIALSAVIGNTLVILAVWRYRRLRTVTNCFVVSLATADLLVSVLVLPLNIVVEITGEWTFGGVLCDLWISSDVLLCTASILNLCCISLDRYFAITKPLVYSTKRSKRLATFMVAVTWCLAAAVTCPPIFGWKEEGREEREGVCQLIRDPGYIIYSSCGSFFIPLMVMMFVYGRIYHVARKREKKLKPYRKKFYSTRRLREDSDMSDPSLSPVTLPLTGLSTAWNGRSPTLAPTATLREPQQRISERCSRNSATAPRLLASSSVRARPFHPLNTNDESEISRRNKVERSLYIKERKTAKTLAIVVGCFVICWLPFFLVYVIEVFCDSCVIATTLFSALTWLGYFNSTLNPLIYALYNTTFRSAFWNLTFGLFCPTSVKM